MHLLWTLFLFWYGSHYAAQISLQYPGSGGLRLQPPKLLSLQKCATMPGPARNIFMQVSFRRRFSLLPRNAYRWDCLINMFNKKFQVLKSGWSISHACEQVSAPNLDQHLVLGCGFVFLTSDFFQVLPLPFQHRAGALIHSLRPLFEWRSRRFLSLSRQSSLQGQLLCLRKLRFFFF